MVDEETAFVILGQAFGGEGLGTGAGDENAVNRAARKGAAHACRGEGGADVVPDHHVARMGFGKFVAVMAGDPGACALRFGADRELHEIRMVERAVHQRESGGMDHILGIVKDERAHAQVTAPLVLADCTIDAIEAVGLRRRAVTIMDDDPQARVGRERDEYGNGGQVIAIAADVEA